MSPPKTRRLVPSTLSHMEPPSSGGSSSSSSGEGRITGGVVDASRTITGLTGFLARMSTECGACGGAITKGVDAITRGPSGGSCHVHLQCAGGDSRSHQHQNRCSVPGGSGAQRGSVASAHGAMAPRRLEPDLKDAGTAAVVGGGTAAVSMGASGMAGTPGSLAVPPGSWAKLMEGIARELAKLGPDVEPRVAIRAALDSLFPGAGAMESATRNLLWLKWCNFVGLPFPFRYMLEALGAMDVVSARTMVELPRCRIEQMDALIDADIAAAAAAGSATVVPVPSPPTKLVMSLSKAVTCMLKAKAMLWDGSR